MAEGVEEQASGTDLNELAITPIVMRGGLYRAVFR